MGVKYISRYCEDIFQIKTQIANLLQMSETNPEEKANTENENKPISEEYLETLSEFAQGSLKSKYQGVQF